MMFGTKKRKVLIVFDYMMADIESNKKIFPIITELFLRGRKLTCFYITILFQSAKTLRLNDTLYSIMKISNEREVQQIASNHSSDIDFKDFMKVCKDYTKEPCSFLVIDTTLKSDIPLRFRKKLLKK